jgi:hypothetical protein
MCPSVYFKYNNFLKGKSAHFVLNLHYNTQDINIRAPAGFQTYDPNIQDQGTPIGWHQ